MASLTIKTAQIFFQHQRHFSLSFLKPYSCHFYDKIKNLYTRPLIRFCFLITSNNKSRRDLTIKVVLLFNVCHSSFSIPVYWVQAEARRRGLPLQFIFQTSKRVNFKVCLTYKSLEVQQDLKRFSIVVFTLMLKWLVLTAVFAVHLSLKPCEPFGTRIFYGGVVQNQTSPEKLIVYFNTASECSRSYLQIFSKTGLQKLDCETTNIRLSETVNYYKTSVHRCRVTSINFEQDLHYKVFGWEGGANNPISFSQQFIPIKLADVRNKNRKVNLIVLADWSFLETDKYQPLDKIFNSLQSDKEINGMLINGDIGYDLWTNNCQNYEKFIVMISKYAQTIPVIFATGNHQYASDQNFQLYQKSFQMYKIDVDFASGLEFGSAYLAPFDPFQQVYNDDIIRDIALENMKKVLEKVKTTERFIVSSSHYPMSCSGTDQNCVDLPKKLSKYWQAMYNAKVSLYFGAHDHSYQRSLPIYPNGTFSKKSNNYHSDDGYIISIVEGVAGNDEGIIQSIDQVKDITVSYTVAQTGLGLLQVGTDLALYSHYSTKHGVTDQVAIFRVKSHLQLNI